MDFKLNIASVSSMAQCSHGGSRRNPPPPQDLLLKLSPRLAQLISAKSRPLSR
ncbi:hypothetical protein F2Q69_00019237 [Brassica cretica]|uniref:Uncharacterized protein n=1 Tax=Brassica cretica TaxID=69181 RepID=A0A8S9QCR7_BRACR|nr:hypothetical protein F2Q69_00019237 [Brassica cretica]